MVWQKEKGIILSCIRHNDKTVIVHIFTEGYGYVSYVYHIPSAKPGRRGILPQPLTLIEFESRIVQTDNLQHLKEVANIFPFNDIPFNPVKSSIALFAGELLTYALREESENRRLFAFLSDAIREFDSLPDAGNFHLYLMLHTTIYLGISPNTDEYRTGYMLDKISGTFTAGQPPHQEFLSPEMSYKTVSLMQCGTARQASLIPMTGSERSCLLSAMNDYFRLHIPNFPKLKSVEILQEVFS